MRASILLLAILVAPAFAQVDEVSPVRRVLLSRPAGTSSVFGTANANCPQATCDTVWVGHSGPGFLGVAVGGLWDFDTGIAGTDSTQGWHGYLFPYTLGADRTATQRLEWAFDYGNMVNLGNTNLWHARDLAGRKYVRTGIVSAWHPDDMAGVKRKLSEPLEPSAVPIAGARSAWCGLRGPGDTHAVDPLTGNAINGDLYNTFGVVGPSGVVPDFPGFCSLWDQLLYKDFPSAGAGTVSFRVRTDMSNFIDTTQNGSGWFNPDPTSPANFVNNPADSFMVYVGSPSENAYDTNRRWLSEILDFAQPLREVFAVSGKYPAVSPDTTISRTYSGIQPVSGVVRVVFRVKTNRVRADGVVGTATAFNSKDGAAVLDQVQVNGGPVYGFESVSDILPRELAGNIALPGTAWVGTGKPVSADFHIHDLASLLYEDLCGGVGSPTRHCNMIGNVLAAGNHDGAELCTVELRQAWESPTIDLAVRTAAPGTKNAQGIDRETALRTTLVLDYDVYTGFMGLDQSIFWQYGARFHGPSSTQPQSGNRTWSPSQLDAIPIFEPDPFCVRGSGTGTLPDDISFLGVPPGNIDSLRVELATLSQGWRFGGTDLGNTRGTYFDNIRVGFVRASAATLLSQTIWDKFQDQFPWNESVAPGDNAAFDTTTALVRTGLNTVAPATASGVVPGDSILATAPYLGDGVVSGVRMDLVFRIDPGPGNYSVKGDRGSPLVDRDPAHPFFAAYLANNGPFGTPGGHGGTWNRNVWNSARMDSAEKLISPILSRGIGGPSAPLWMGALHEDDPNFAALGIAHNVCFLADPNGPDDESNLDCDGVPPAGYGAAPGTTKEGTKILPDGWFSPGTHVEYFLRRSLIESPGTAILLFDTTRVFPQDPSGNVDLDQERWSSFDVLPDLWKSTRYGGAGLACLLVIDAADRRGANPAIRGALDSLAYGRSDGATQGWHAAGPNTDPNDPSGFVAANLGMYGLNYDQYDVRAAEALEAGHPGVRFATNPGAILNKRDTSGPSAAQLAAFYTTVLWSSGDLDDNTIHDGIDSQESANDIALLEGFLEGATPSNRRGVMLDGDGIMEDAKLKSDDGTHLYPFLTDLFGADLSRPDYRGATSRNTFGMLPVGFWAHPGRVYGADFTCENRPDVLIALPTVDGAAEAMLYENVGPSPWTAAVYRPRATGREFRTLIDGFDLSHLRGNYANLAQIGSLPGTNFAQLYWLDDVMTGHFQICGRRGGFVGVGDLPGMSPARFTNAVLGAMPNPSFAGRKVALRFTLARAQDVTLRVHDVAGRVVARLPMKGLAGPNAFEWDGRMASGARAPAGVYFYALDGIDAKASKMILLSAN